MPIALPQFLPRLSLLALLLWPLSAPVPAPAQEATTTSHGISAFGELKYPADFAHFDYADPQAPKGGTMSFRGTGASATFDSLNAFILRGEPAQGLGLLYDTLLTRAYDEPDAAYGLLASRIEYPQDRSWVIFTLRPEARFADGHPVTAEDVVFTFETLKTDGSPRIRVQVEDVESVTALSEHEVRVDFLDDVPARDLISTVGQVEILPAHYYETVDFARSTMEPPLGSGPYVVDSANPGRSITYCRNPDYWGARLPVNVGANTFDCIRYEYFTDNTAAFEALKSGAYVFHEEFTSATWATGYDFPALDRGWVVQETIPDNRPSGAQGFWFNMRRDKFQDRRVREAIGLAFNFEWSNETLFYGLYGRTDSFWENSPLQAEGMAEGAELALLEEYRDRLPETVFTEPAYSPPESAVVATDRAMLRRAGRLLDEAGWTVGDDGLRRNAAGEVLSVELLDDSPVFERIALPFIANLEQLGIDAGFALIDPAQYQERQETFDYDMVITRFVLSLSPSVELRTLFGSAAAEAPGSYNLTGLADPVVDELIDRIIEAEDRETMETRVRALDRVLRDRMIWVPNWTKGSHWLAYWDMFGRPDSKPDYSRGDSYWWIDPAKRDALQQVGALR